MEEKGGLMEELDVSLEGWGRAELEQTRRKGGLAFNGIIVLEVF